MELMCSDALPHITSTSNKKHFKEINSYIGMTMVKKEQGQDDYFQVNQQSILLTLSANTSPLIVLADNVRSMLC